MSFLVNNQIISIGFLATENRPFILDLLSVSGITAPGLIGAGGVPKAGGD